MAISHFPWLAGANGIVYLGAYDELYALNMRDGSVRWQYQVKPVHALLAGKIIYVWSSGNILYALDAMNGKKLWHRAVDEISDVTLLSADGVLYAAANSGGGISAFRERDGFLLWQYVLGQGKMTLNVTNGILYVANTAEVLALHVRDGSLLWKYSLHQEWSPEKVTHMVVEPPFIFVLDLQLNVLQMSDGKLLWKIPMVRQFAVGKGVVYVITDVPNKYSPTGFDYFGNKLLAVRKSDGASLWHSSHNIENASQDMFFMKDRLYIAGTITESEIPGVQTVRGVVNSGNDEILYQNIRAFKTSDGTGLWTYPDKSQQMLLRFDTTHVYTFANDVLTAINLQDGQQAWQHKTVKTVEQQGLLLDGATIYAGTGGNGYENGGCGGVTNSTLAALNTTNGRQRWQFSAASGSGPALT